MGLGDHRHEWGMEDTTRLPLPTTGLIWLLEGEPSHSPQIHSSEVYCYLPWADLTTQQGSRQAGRPGLGLSLSRSLCLCFPNAMAGPCLSLVTGRHRDPVFKTKAQHIVCLTLSRTQRREDA